MSDVRDWDRNANNNNDPPPDGAPEGQTAGSVNDCIRENMAAVKRLDDDHNGSLSSGGAGGNYIVVSAQLGLTAYYAGMVIAFIANHENPSAASVNVSTLGDRPLTNPYGLTLVGKEIRAGQIVVAVYDNTNAWFQVVSQLAPSILRAEKDGTLTDEQVLIDYLSAQARIQVKGPSGTPASTMGLFTTTSAGATNEALRISDLQNIGLSVVPKNWSSTYTAMQIGGTGALWSKTSAAAGQDLYLDQNVWFDGAFKRLVADEASEYRQLSGAHLFRVAPSDAADSTISWTNVAEFRNDGGVSMPQVYNDIISTAVRDLEIDSSGRLGYQSSSERYKENIRPMPAPEFLHSLAPVQYERPDSQATEIGLIAEEVEKIAPEYVWKDEAGLPSGVNYKGLIVPILAEVQRLRDRVDAMERAAV